MYSVESAKKRGPVRIELRRIVAVEPDSGSAVVAGLRRLLTDAALRRQLGAGALATALARDWGAVYDRLLADYQAAIDAKAATRAA